MNNAMSTYLYKRDANAVIPRIAAVHDLCGYGKCSLGVAIPVLSAAGCDVCPVPTSLFSAHTKFPVFHMHDTTDMLASYLDAWRQEGIELDAVYSGFLGAPEQVQAIQRLYHEYPKALRIVDPVMGDAGKKYPTYTDELCAAMADLVDGADLLTPNLTEACLLTDTEYTGQAIDLDTVKHLCDSLLQKGARYVVLKGIDEGENLANYIAGVDMELTKTEVKKLPYMLHGTGDLYCSAVLSAVMCGKSLLESVEFANNFVVHAMQETIHQPDFEMRGVSFETVLGDITSLYNAR